MPTDGKIRSVLLLQPRDGDYGSLLTFFSHNDILGLAVREAGCRNAELQVPLAGSGPVLVTALWDSAEAYDRWRNHPARATFADDMGRLTEPTADPIASGLYMVAIAAERAAA